MVSSLLSLTSVNGADRKRIIEKTPITCTTMVLRNTKKFKNYLLFLNRVFYPDFRQMPAPPTYQLRFPRQQLETRF